MFPLGVAVKYCNETRKLQILLKSPEYQAVTSEVPHVSSEYAELQNKSQQEIPPCSTGKLVSPGLFDEINDTFSEDFLQKSILKDIVLQVFQIKRSEYLHWVPGHFFKKKVPWRTRKNLKSVTCQRFPKIENILFVNKNKYFLRDTIEVLELPHIFVQADKQLYVRILHIKWKKRDLY